MPEPDPAYNLSGSSILVIDVGGSHVKLMDSVNHEPTQFDSGSSLTAEQMVRETKSAAAKWQYDVVSIGLPGPVRNHRLIGPPPNLGPGWVGFDFAEALGKPVRIINDAAMQALGGYRGGRMLFLGLGTGLGAALVENSIVLPMELAHLPYKDGLSFEDFVGDRGLARLGPDDWMQHVVHTARLFRAAFLSDEIVLGGGNARLFDKMPDGFRRGANADAFSGGFRLWEDSTTR